ncbi:molybdate ABC transporter substrate-binding protein [Virgibacillus siamensis]|uniref:molybdate ABC transporter substrate-binding protein n=1 Tax=Virgibacillus siamensis TaxID=480071 RepID=UPI000986B340|nr:molybdate ABC transporter substrate-binding protein [Virgibacillus siamensis]
MKYIKYISFILIIILVSGCSNQAKDAEHKIFVSAAASLSGPLNEIVDEFEKENPDTIVTLQFGASGKLAQQIQQGAPVDVFLSADEKRMDLLASQDMIVPDTRTNFTRNKLVLIANKNSAIQINTLKNLPQTNVSQIAIGNPKSVPAGTYTKQALENVGIWDSLAEKFVYAKDVRQVLTYVESGNTDLGFVYASDLKRSGLVKGISKINADLYDPIVYPAAVTASSETKKQAKSFIQFLKSDKAQTVLSDAGFGS